MKTLRLLSFCWIALFTSTLFAKTPPELKWRVLETDHFSIIYEKKHKKMALEYAKAAELSFKVLSHLFTEAPSKIPLVLMDITDQANGFATFLPYPYITLFPVLPDPFSSISQYQHWPFELVLHEYTHILNFYPVHGFYTPFKYIIGTIVRPNGFLPRWYMEGLAVAMESFYSPYGRLSSPATHAALRALAQKNQLQKESIDRINEVDIPQWPFGQRPYLLGSLVWQNILSQHKISIAEKLNQRFSRRIPFMLRAPAVEETGKTFPQHLSQIYKQLKRTTLKQIKKIKHKGREHLKAFHHSGTGQFNQSISPNKRYLVYTSAEIFKGGEVRLVQRNHLQESFSKKNFKVLFYAKGVRALSWLPNSQAFLFNKTDIYNRHYAYNDLYIYHLKSQKTQRLTYGERAQSPALSPNGEQAVYVQLSGWKTVLKQIHLKTRKVQTLYDPGPFKRLSSPTFINPTTLVFSLRNKTGQERLYRFSLKTRKATPLLPHFSSVSRPRMTSKGLVFISSRTGIPNLYLSSNLQQASAISNTSTLVADATWDPGAKEWITSRLTTEGLKLFSSRTKAFSPPHISPLFRVKKASPLPSPLKTKMPSVTEKKYSPLPYLVPRYWIPFFYFVEGGVWFQGSTTVSDPLGKHTYSLFGSFDTFTQKPSYALSYVNQETPVDLGASYGKATFVAANALTLQTQSANVFASFFIPSLSNNWRMGVGGRYLSTDLPSSKGPLTVKQAGPSIQLQYSNAQEVDPYPFLGGNQSFYIQWVSYRKQKDFLAYDQLNTQFSYSLKKPFPSRHNLSWKIQTSLAPQLPTAFIPYLGSTALGGNYLASLINSSHIMRGYPSGEFYGKTLISSNLEYHMPVKDIYKGHLTDPYFVKSLSANFFVDTAWVDGFFLDKENTFILTSPQKAFWGLGAELLLNMTAFYHLPIGVITGAYYGLNAEANGGFQFFLGLSFSGLSQVTQKPSSQATWKGL